MTKFEFRLTDEISIRQDSDAAKKFLQLYLDANTQNMMTHWNNWTWIFFQQN